MKMKKLLFLTLVITMFFAISGISIAYDASNCNCECGPELNLNPPEATNQLPYETCHDFTATVTFCEIGIPGIPVDFETNFGLFAPENTQTVSRTTDSNGEAAVIICSCEPGIATITATVSPFSEYLTNGMYNCPSLTATAKKTWLPESEISIDIEKSTNGQDADTAPGPYITVGGTVTWTYVVTNTGDVTLYDIEVTDDVLGSIGTIDSLAPGALETFTVNGTAVAGQYENIGTVTAVTNQYNGIVAAVYEEEIPYSDSDYSHYFGSVPPPPPPPPVMASLGDRIWYDADADGVQDAGESGINGVTVDLWLDDGDGIIDGGDTFIGTQTTTGDGGYDFTGLAAGDYIVDVTDTGGVLAGFELISGTDPLVVVLGAGVNYIDADFGYQAAALPYTETGSISGTVFADIDGDDIQDEDEPGVSGVTVTLSGDDSATTTTDADGYYIFADLLPGNYTVTITIPDGYTSADPDISVVLAMGEDKVVNFPLDPKMLPYTEEESLEVLPYTGFNFVPWWLFGLGLMGAGITLLTLSKQREF